MYPVLQVSYLEKAFEHKNNFNYLRTNAQVCERFSESLVEILNHLYLWLNAKAFKHNFGVLV